MALYSLPEQPSSKSQDGYVDAAKDRFRGKISEDFFFPAGDWNGIEGAAGSFDDYEEPHQSWRRRKRRAIMSYDPLEVSMEDLHLVIRVFRAVRPSENEGETQQQSLQRKKSIGSKIKRTLQGKKNHVVADPFPTMQSTSLLNEDARDLHALFEETGVRFLEPKCFSVTPAFSATDAQHKQESALFFPFPDTAETQEDFLDRLSSLSTTHPVPHGGCTDLLTSRLGQDFARALLDEPPELHSALDDAAPLGPQLLADVTGDGAIGFDGLSSSSEGAPSAGQRSQLRRLPPSQESGYASSFDLKEVLYLPPRSSPRRYEDDAALCASALLNLLYVYPRLIRCKNGHSQMVGNKYLSLRVRVVEQELPLDQSFDSLDPAFQPLQAIYNPSTPAGPPLVDSFFTKLMTQHGDRRESKKKAGQKDIPLNDEVKIRLPDILDRRHFLQTSLFTVASDLSIRLIAETTIPFIISSKESTSGSRVTTIIPNGLHRIQLVEGLQIHVETRLASSSHISDPSVATLLRDYPVVSNAAKSNGDLGDMDSTGSNSQVIVHASSGHPFLDILTMASGQAVKRHFSSLLIMNMLNLANQKCPPFYFEQLFDMFHSDVAWHRLVAWEETDSLLAIMRNIIEILDKTRTSYIERDRSMLSLQYHRLIKSFLDAFDEPLFTSYHSDDEMQYSETADSSIDKHFNDSSDSHAMNDSSYIEPSFELNESKTERNIRIPKYQFTSPRSKSNPKKFSRKAFVATRSEQMRVEAELNDDYIYGKEYFDDDETVITLGTTASRFDYGGSVFPIILEAKSTFQEDIIQSNSSTLEIQESNTNWTCGSRIVSTTATPPKKRSPRKDGSSTPFSFATKRAEYMANRVAQLVIAPCTAPSADDMIADGVNGTMVSSLINGKIQGANRMTGVSGNKSPFEPGSDAEDEGETNEIAPYLRGNQSCLKIPPLVFQPMRDSDDSGANEEYLPTSNSPYLYEMVMALWVQAWTSIAASMKSDSQVRGSSHTVWPYELVQGSHNSTNDAAVAFAFIRHLSFFLPLCLKSLGLRCSQSDTTKLNLPMTFLDEHHMQILVPLVETIALGLMREAMSGSNGVSNAEQMLFKAVTANDDVLDFFIGLFALLHPSQVEMLLLSYFNLLENCEDPSKNGANRADNIDKSYLRRIKCARQIRLHAVERLSAMPSFARLNFPLKFTGFYPRKKKTSNNWINQKLSDQPEDDAFQQHWGKVDRSPQSFWLSGLLMNQCLSICNGACGMIIMEASKQAKALKRGRKVDNALLRDDLLRLESLAFHSVLCAYELLIKRQAMDSRFQTISSGTRVAALFTTSVLQQSVDAVSLLARMDPDQKVRVIWILCLLYILQEGPDALIRDELQRFCNLENNRISNLVQLLKLTSLTCQHFIPSDESLPVVCAKEMTQEAFNCISASVILLVDECFDVVSKDEYELEKLGQSVFDLLLHLLSTPLSSVTLLRTLGGSAHALDKFGVVIFLKTVGNQLQHWGRMVLTMMNAMELSIRSMAVDFLVSLIGSIYQECGSIESISLCLLSVLPEVAAREIALCSVSGLIKSMEDVESSVWPLRRAFADVEETSPLDDDRIDHQLLSPLTTLCRTGQAIIDGVLVEIRLKCSGDLNLEEIAKAQLSGSTTVFRQLPSLPPKTVFDADEESILEAATYFSLDTGLAQKLRWLCTLTDLHVAKMQWSEVAESSILCAHSLIEYLDHLPNLWRPSQFDLWNDYRRSPWLSSVGLPDSRGNVAVMELANAFLEPHLLNQQPNHFSVEGVCSMLISAINQVEASYVEENGAEYLVCSHLEELLSMITTTINDESKNHQKEAQAALRRVRAHTCSKLAFFSEERDAGKGLAMRDIDEGNGTQMYVRVVLHGNKPRRFQESTNIPTFFEWEMPSICHVPKHMLMTAASTKHQKESWEECICRTYAKPLLEALKSEDTSPSIVATTEQNTDETKTYISVAVVQKKGSIKSRKFFVRHDHDNSITEYTVAHKFPHALSRQRSMITSEIRIQK